MRKEQVEALLRARESAGVEFKKSLADTRRIIMTIASMATIGGGILLIGVDPNGRPAGIDMGEGDQERLVQRILAHTDPKIYVDLDVVDLDGKQLLVIRVPPGDGPHLAFGRAYYRSGPTNVAMTRDEYERRLMDRLRESGGYERASEVDWSLERIDETAVRSFVDHDRARQELPGEDAKTILTRLHLLREGRPSVAGLLLFGKAPQGPLPQATIRARVIRGANREDAAIGGTLFEQIESASKFVGRNIKVRSLRTDVVRKEHAELPPDAVREVIANAVVHRDYRSTAPIQLRLDDQCLVVWNPGHFPPPITPALLRQEHPSVPTNPLLARALHLAGYIEDWGTGTLRIIQSLRENGNPEPLFEDDSTAGGIRVTLPLPGAILPSLQPRIATFVEALAAGQRFRTAEYAESAHIAHRTALEDLRLLESLGLISREGRGKAVRWLRT